MEIKYEFTETEFKKKFILTCYMALTRISLTEKPVENIDEILNECFDIAFSIKKELK